MLHFRSFSLIIVLCSIWILPQSAATREQLPPCLEVDAGTTIAATLLETHPAPVELLARLAYAEGRSTGFAEDNRIYQGIAWGVMNRVRLGESAPSLRRRYGDGITGVIFKKGQFNPAVSIRSPFSRDFLCPRDPTNWQRATNAAQTALYGKNNPFIQTDWEHRHGLSLVVNFYYPGSPQARGPQAPWEGDRELTFIGAAFIEGTALPAERIRFYRLTTPPLVSNP